MTTAVRTTTQTDRTTFMEVGIMEDNRTELNKAIFYVITHNIPKKEMKEQVRLIKKSGYQVEKGGRKNWYIYNPTTTKTVSAEVTWREIRVWNNSRFQYTINIEGCTSRTEQYNKCHIDFVAILEKPINHTWIRLLDQRNYSTYWWYKTPTQEKMAKLKDAKQSVRYKAKQIKETQKKIEELQAELIRYAGETVERKNKLNEVRRQLGLQERS